MQQDIWNLVCDEFDASIPRLTGLNVKEDDCTNNFVYPSGWDTIGYNFDFSDESGYSNTVKFTINFGMYEYNNYIKSINQCKVVFDRCCYYPSLIKRNFRMPHIGFKGVERMGRSAEGGLTWDFDIESMSDFYTLDNCFFSVLASNEEFSVYMKDNVLNITFKDMNYFIGCSRKIEWALYKDDISMKQALKLGAESECVIQKGRYLVIRHEIKLKPEEHYHTTFGFSKNSLNSAFNAANDDDFEVGTAARWNEWFRSLPNTDFFDEREKNSYYKSWAVVRSNYYKSPLWGHSALEAMPVYKGIWQWAMSAIEWLSDQDTYLTSEWFRNAMDFFIKNQREDGYLTHAMYIDEGKPGERWAADRVGIVQTPHFPWVALRYYYSTNDEKALMRWYEPLKKYYEYLNNTRDKNFRNIHLWAIITSFDTGLDTTSAFHKVTYGENGITEAYCYPAIFAAARYRYEQSMGIIADILGFDSCKWFEESRITKNALDQYLWDDDKKWYGVMHEDETLDTRVGIDGLFPLAYKMVDEDRVQLMEANFKKLIGKYGIYTVAPGENGFKADIYWRGAAWPQSCSVGMQVARNYYPSLLDSVVNSTINMTMSNPGIWECYNAMTGELARSDQGFVCTPSVTTNVGAGGVIGSLMISHGFDMYGIDDVIPLVYLQNYHWAGMRINVKNHDGGWYVTCRREEENRGCLKFVDNNKNIYKVNVKEGEEVFITQINH